MSDTVRSPRQKVIAVVILLAIVLLGQVFMLAYRHFYTSRQDEARIVSAVECAKKGRQWASSDKTETPFGSCH